MACAASGVIFMTEGGDRIMSVDLRPGESQDSLLKRFRKAVAEARILPIVRQKRWFTSKSEVKRIKRRKELLETYVQHTVDLRLPVHDEFTRFCLKMATGSGKTKVMAMAIAWQYANAVRTNAEEYASNFLILAPNVIVFERLRTDFEGGRMFHTDPLVPRHFKMWWDVQFYMRGDGERAQSSGAVYLTNIQQLHEGRSDVDPEDNDPVSTLLGPEPPASLQETADLFAEGAVGSAGVQIHENLL